jgi:chromosome segregation ATPase
LLDLTNKTRKIEELKSQLLISEGKVNQLQLEHDTTMEDIQHLRAEVDRSRHNNLELEESLAKAMVDLDQIEIVCTIYRNP